MPRQQLPPQIKKLEVLDRKAGKTVVRYQLTLDSGENPLTGNRQQVRRRYATEKQARDALSEIGDQASKGTFVARAALTVEQMCVDYLTGRHNLRPTSSSKVEYDLGPLRQRHGDMLVQRLTKAHLDTLVSELVAGGTKTAKGRTRRPWAAVSVNKAIDAWAMVLADAHQQGLVTRNVGEHVAHVAARHKQVDTYTEAEVTTLLAAIADNRLGHAWELALSGLRRGEVAGLRWCDIDLNAKTLSIVNNRVSAAGTTVENDPKSAASRRTLPLPDRLVSVLKAAKARQAAERLALGGGMFAYVVSNEFGEPYSPAALSRYWRDVREGRGHPAYQAARRPAYLRHAMHLQGAAWRDRRMDRAQRRQSDDAPVRA